MITPDLSADFPDPVFLLFWGMHLLIVWAAVYLTWGLGHAPTWRHYRAAVTVTALWAIGVYGFNAWTGSNYGYLNAKPGAASILDYLGDWPVYVFAEIAIVLTVWALMTWPWVRTAAAGRGLSASDLPATARARPRGWPGRRRGAASRAPRCRRRRTARHRPGRRTGRGRR